MTPEEEIIELEDTIRKLTIRMHCGHIYAHKRLDGKCEVCLEIGRAVSIAKETLDTHNNIELGRLHREITRLKNVIIDFEGREYVRRLKNG